MEKLFLDDFGLLKFTIELNLEEHAFKNALRNIVDTITTITYPLEP